MVNEFKLTVVHFARHNPMQICAKKLWKIRTGPPGFRASGPRAVMGRGPRAAGPSWAVGRGKLAGGLLLAKPHNNCHRIHKRDISTKYRHVQIFLWIFASIGLQCHEYHYFASLGVFMHQGCRMQRLTKSLRIFLYGQWNVRNESTGFTACGCRFSRSYTVYSRLSKGWLLGFWAYQTMQLFLWMTTKQ